MANEGNIANGDPVNVRCFTFSDPVSINGPSGNFQLWSEGNKVLGRLTMQTLFGLGTITLLNLAGFSHQGKDSIVCALHGRGYTSQDLGHIRNPVAIQLAIQVTFSPDWSQGTLEITTGLPQPGSGLPVKLVTCPAPG